MNKKIIVIGAGIIGASIAYHLAKNGAEVTVIEKSLPASGATSKSFSWINSSTSETLDYYQLRTASIAAYRTLEEELDDDEFKVCWGGSLNSTKDDADLARQAIMLRDFGCPLREIDSDEFQALEPHIYHAKSKYLHAETDGAINPVYATNALLRAASRLGAQLLYGCEVISFLKTGNSITGLKTNLGAMNTDQVVVAAGSWSQDLLAHLNIKLPMNNSYGLMVHTKPVRQVLSHVIISDIIDFRQEHDGRIIAAVTYSGGNINEAPFDIASKVITHLKNLLPQIEEIEIGHVMIGKRPIPQDGFPVAGFVEEVEGLYVSVMHSGITLAPIIGQLAADEMLFGTQSKLLEPYRLSRFS